MAGKSNTSATFFAQKKLLGKAHTSNLKTDGEELIGSNIQAATSLLFGEEIPQGPSLDLYTIQSASNGAPGTVEYIPFILTALTGTTYDANNSNPDGGSGQDSGESGQAAGPHTYKFVFPSNYQSNSSNSRKGNGLFNDNQIVHETLGKVQLVPPFFSQNAPNPYIVKIYKDNGSGGVGDEIPLLDNIDWNVDYYNGILFLQDYNASKIPAHARAFAYVGKMADEVISSGSSSGGGSGDSSATYIVQAATGSLSAERVLTAGTGVTLTDAGANSTLTAAIDDAVVATISGSQFRGNVGITGSFGVKANVSGDYAAVIDNDQSSNGHGLKVTSDGTGAGTRIFDVESDSTTLFRIRGDGRVGIGKVTSLPTSKLTVSSSNSDSDIAIAHKIQHIGDSNTFMSFQTDSVLFQSDIVSGRDNSFFVSGSVGSAGSADRGTSVFGGDLLVSGTFFSPNGLSGSLTRLSNGSSYLVEGSNITITSSSNGSVTISAASTPNNVYSEYLGSSNGVNTLFSFNHAPTENKNISVYVNGLLQMPATTITSAPFQDYSVTGSNVYFMSSSIPMSGSLILANYSTNEAI